MRNILFSFLLSFFVLNSVLADNLKIGILNSSVVESKALVILDIANKNKAVSEKIQKDIASKEQSLQKEVKELEQKKSVLSEAALNEKQQALQQKVMSWQEDLKKDNEAIERAKLESLSQVDAKAKEIIDSLSKKNNLDFVFSSQGLLYNNPSASQDITEDFIKELNDSIKKSDFDEYFKKYSSKSKK